ncbi:hypothetical protein OAS14_00860 [Alphaproteobacteria bacterium]|nr:hypothetical protein [Alphaproteobacteria bacterium]
MDERTKLVAKKISDFLRENGNVYQKSIIFCVDQGHASCMWQALINENQKLGAENSRYAMRITGNDKEEQEQFVDFISRWEGSKRTAALPEKLGADGLPLELIASNLGEE